MSPKKNIGSPNANLSLQKKSKQSSEDEKATLRNQIKTLRSLKSIVKQKLNNPTINLENTRHSSQTNDLSEVQVKTLPFGNVSVKHELFNFAGIQCIKFFKDEYIFHFLAKAEGNRTCVYSVQFFNVGNKGEIGKYIMPKFMDIETILKETPLDNITYAMHFLRNCKHYIDCFHNRMDQFITLEKSLKKVTNCNLFRIKLSYEWISLELLGVYDKEAEDHISIIVYLFYDLKETRPHLIKLETLRGTPLNKETEKGLKSYLKAFKKVTLIEALESIENEEDPLFSWKKTGQEQIDLSLQDSDESSEECIPQRKRIRTRNLRRLEDESSADSEIAFRQRIKGRKKTKRKISISSGNITVEDVKDVESRKISTKSRLKKLRSVKNKNLSANTDLVKKGKGRINPKPTESDITKFLTKYKNLPESKDPKESREEESEKEKSSEVSRILEQKTVEPTEKETSKLSRVELTPVENIEIGEKIKKKKPMRRDPVMEKINEHEISGEGRVLRSSRNSPTKAGSPSKATPKTTAVKKVVTRSKKLITPKNIAPSKKVVSLKKPALSRITISPNTVKTTMKQTNLKFPAGSQNSPSSEMTETIKPDYKLKSLKSKVVTSTPMILPRKEVKQPLDTDLDISDIESNANPQIEKCNVQSSVVLEKVVTKSEVK